MRIGIIFYSKTGNTKSVAERLFKKLSNEFEDVKIEEITITGDIEKGFQIDNNPPVNDYDIVVFGSWVMAFSLNPVMKKYLSMLPSLKDKKIFCMVTQHFPYKWMGGSNCLNQMRKIVKSKYGELYLTDVVSWTNKKREEQIEKIISSFNNAIQELK